MDDAISRKQAIDAFNTNINELVVAGKENADSVERYLNRVIDEIKQLPPIQPVNNSENPNSSDSISRRAAISAIDECYCGGEDSCGEPWIYKENAVEAINMIEPLPPAEPKGGKWTLKSYRWECDQCGCLIRRNPFKGNKWNYNYCPNCGADMREVTT